MSVKSAAAANVFRLSSWNEFYSLVELLEWFCFLSWGVTGKCSEGLCVLNIHLTAPSLFQKVRTCIRVKYSERNGFQMKCWSGFLSTSSSDSTPEASRLVISSASRWRPKQSPHCLCHKTLLIFHAVTGGVAHLHHSLVDHGVNGVIMCLFHSESIVLITLCNKAAGVSCLFKISHSHGLGTDFFSMMHTTNNVVFVHWRRGDTGLLRCLLKDMLLGGIRLMIFPYHRNALGLGQEECSR